MRARLKALWAGTNDFDIVGTFRWGVILSLVAVAVSVASLFTRELSLGIEFEGGVAWEVNAPGVSVADARDALGAVGQESAKIQIIGRDNLRVEAETVSDADKTKVSEALADLAGAEPEDVNFTDVGPTWGNEVSDKAQRALVVFLVLLAVYIALRFEWRMAVAALVSVTHDVIITVGVYSVLQFEVTPATVIAFLTILGFSLYDTVVVFDKVNENLSLPAAGRSSFSQVLNLSMNEVLLRSINTSVAAVLPVLSMLVVGSRLLGAATLEEFALALFIGLLSGAYSSIYTAAPMLQLLHRRDPRFARRAGTARERPRAAAAVGAGAGAGPASRREPMAEPVAEGDLPPESPFGAGAPIAPGPRPAVRPQAGPASIAPRPRKKRRR